MKFRRCGVDFVHPSSPGVVFQDLPSFPSDDAVIRREQLSAPMTFIRLSLALAAVRTCLLLLAVLLATTPASARPASVRAGQGSGTVGLGLSIRSGFPTLPRSSNPDVGVLSRQYRLERLTNATPRLFDIVPPAPPDLAASSPLPGYRLIPLGRKRNNRLCFTAMVAGTKGLIMLDTGATNTALNETTYRSLRLGGASRLPAGVPRALSINGTTTPLAEAPDFQVGPSNLGAVPVCLIPRTYLQDGAADGQGQLYDGLLGQNILRHYQAMIDCTRRVLYLDLDPAKKVNLASSFARNGWTRVPMIDTGSHFLVPCVLNGHRFRLVVDTGAPFTSLDLNLLKDAQVPSRPLPFRSNLIGRAPSPVSLVDLDHLQIGDYVAKDVHLTATAQSLAEFAGRGDRSPDEPVIGLLGGDLLARHGAIIDIGNRALYLRANTAPAAPVRQAKR